MLTKIIGPIRFSSFDVIAPPPHHEKAKHDVDRILFNVKAGEEYEGDREE